MSLTLVSAEQAIARHVREGERVLLGTGAGEAMTLQAALVNDRERLAGLRLCSGLQLGEYGFMGPVRDGSWTYETWHPMGPIRDDVDSGTVAVHLSRGAFVLRLISRLDPDVFLTSVSPPGPDGTLSFGASVSYALPMAQRIKTVIAEVNPNMPWVRGNTSLPPERFTALVEVGSPLPTRAAAVVDSSTSSIVENVRRLLPERPCVQIGLGSVPESLVAELADDPPDGIRLWGMGIDAMVPLLERLGRPDAFVGAEMLGSELLYRYAHDQPTMVQYPLDDISSVLATSQVPGFVAVIGAIEIDLTGQVNSEVAGGRTVSGPGGGFDYIDGSWHAEGGTSLVTLRSTAKGGTVSTIVPQMASGTPVTIPRHSVRHVVTEFGSADLFGLTADARAMALISIAHPDMRGALDAAWSAIRCRP